MDSNLLGNIGEIKSIEYLIRLGYHCYTSASGCGPVDIVAIKADKVLKIECKSSNYIKSTPTGQKCIVQLRSVRYNRNKIESRKFDASKSDICFIWIEQFQKLYIYDSSFLNGKTSIAIRLNTKEVNSTKL